MATHMTEQLSASERDPLTGQPAGSVIETKEFLRTSEFWMVVASIFGLMIAGLALDRLDSPGVSLLVTLLVMGYTLSRGIAKAGSAHPFWGRQMSVHNNPFTNRDRHDEDRDDDNDTLRRIEARLERLERTTAGRITL
jgi:hypothetical protein